jgi:trigger factor
MEIQLNEKGTFNREMILSIPWDECARDYEKTILKLRRKIKLPGFRPGKVPKQVLINQYQPLIEAEFLEHNIQSYYKKALNNEEIQPINQAEVSDVDFSFGQPLSFKASFEIEPEISLPKLKKNKLKVVKPIYKTDDEDVTLAIEEYRRSNMNVKTIENGAEAGDYIICDLQETDAAGNPLIGQKIEKQYLKVGDSQFSEDTNRILTGIKPGESRQISLQANETVSHYKVNTTNVERQILPEINDEFIQQIDPEVSGIEEWKHKIRDVIEKNYDAKSKEQFNQNLFDAMIHFVNPDYPPSMETGYLDGFVEDIKKSGEHVKDEKKVRDMFRPTAVRNLKYFLIRKALIKDQNISVSSEEVEKRINQSCLENPKKEKEIKKYYRKPSHKKRLMDSMIDEKIMDYLEQFAKVTLDTINTADLRKQQKEQTHEH